MKINRMVSKYSFLLLLSIFLVSSCTDNTNQIEERTWNIVWQDEFNGPEGQAPDATKWSHDIGTDWGNVQLEYDTDRTENSSLDGMGNLAIIARKESYAGSAFTSARITTEGIFEQQYGRFEAKIKMPWGPGIWPAFWMLGSNNLEVGWPQCGEIDIVEYRGNQPQIIHGSLHGPGYYGGNPVEEVKPLTKSYGLLNDRFDADFHLFAVEWGEDFIDYYVDDFLYQRIVPEDADGTWVFDQPFYLILNLAVGGNFVGFPSEKTVFPQSMLIDYVRVYKEAK